MNWPFASAVSFCVKNSGRPSGLVGVCLVAGCVFAGPWARAAGTPPASQPRDYHFDGAISREVLENCLSRSISMGGLLNGFGDEEAIRSIRAADSQRQAAAQNYLSGFQATIAQTRSNLATLAKSAERAADEFVAGGGFWVAGRQADFIAEACGRAGGLMAVAPLGERVPANRDVILYAVPGSLSPEDLNIIGQWQEKGATVIKFSSPSGLYRDYFPIDTVANLVELWTWTGEFVAACTRLGKMPVLYQSYGLPGGPERGKKYQGKRFHDDLTVKPIPAGLLGRAYLDQIERMLAKVGGAQMPKILEAAKWWGRATSATWYWLPATFSHATRGTRARSPWALSSRFRPGRTKTCSTPATLHNSSCMSAISSLLRDLWTRPKQWKSSSSISTFSRPNHPNPPAISSTSTRLGRWPTAA